MGWWRAVASQPADSPAFGVPSSSGHDLETFKSPIFRQGPAASDSGYPDLSQVSAQHSFGSTSRGDPVASGGLRLNPVARCTANRHGLDPGRAAAGAVQLAWRRWLAVTGRIESGYGLPRRNSIASYFFEFVDRHLLLHVVAC
jgi:hypothetical protein